MKNKMTALAAVAAISLLYAGATTQASGQSITIDEWGNGTFFDGGGGSTVIPFQMMPDPSGGIGGLVMVYTLPISFVVPGDVLMTEPPAYSINSEVIRFWNNNGLNNQIIFYSDIEDGVDAPADTGLPNQINSLNVTIQESGAEGGFQAGYYTPTPTGPGFIPAGAVTYTFVSDVPEPGALALASGGAVAMLFVFRARKK